MQTLTPRIFTIVKEEVVHYIIFNYITILTLQQKTPTTALSNLYFLYLVVIITQRDNTSILCRSNFSLSGSKPVASFSLFFLTRKSLPIPLYGSCISVAANKRATRPRWIIERGNWGLVPIGDPEPTLKTLSIIEQRTRSIISRIDQHQSWTISLTPFPFATHLKAKYRRITLSSVCLS